MPEVASLNLASSLWTLIVLLQASSLESLPIFSNHEGLLQWKFNSDFFNTFESSCILHFIELQSNFPFSRIERPFQRTKVDIREVRKQILQQSIFKVRHHKCLIQFLIAPETAPSRSDKKWNILEEYLKKRASYNNKNFYQTHILVVFVVNDLLKGQESTVATKIFLDALQLRKLLAPQITLLAYQVDKSHYSHVVSGLYLCSYCANTDPNGWFSFQCTQGSTCYEQIKAAAVEASIDNKGVFWNWDHQFLPSNVIKSVPHLPKINAEIIRAASIGFILEGSNFSWPLPRLRNAMKSVAYNREAIPAVLSVPKTLFFSRNSHSYHFYPVGMSRGLRFITSDGVTDVREGLSTLAPLTPICWLALGISMIVSALVVAAICDTEVHGYRAQVFAITLMWTFRVLTENCHSVTPSTDVRSQRVIRYCKVVLAFWLLMGIVISNAYKCFVKSSFFVPIAYETQWKTLEEIKDFSFYTVIDSNSSFCTKGTVMWRKADNNTNGEFSHDARMSPFNLEAYFHRVRLSRDRIAQNTSFKAEKDVQLINHILRNISLVCQASLHKFIDNDLSVVRTAAVLLAEDLDKYYKIFFDRATRNPRGLQFSHNNDGDDQLMVHSRAFTISGGATQHQELVRDRIKILLSSGVYFMWEKWEWFNEHGGNVFAKKLQWMASVTPRALRMENLNVRFIFCVLLVGLCVATVGFCVEKICKIVWEVSSASVTTVKKS